MVKIDGTRIKKIREDKGLTQLYVATVVGVTTDTISRWENRKYPSIKKENGLKLAEALEVDLEEIIDQTVNEEISEGESLDQDRVTRGEKEFSRIRLIFLILLLLLAGSGTLVFLKTLNQNDHVQAAACRIIPDHAPPGAVFPVIIKIDVRGGGPFSLIVKEVLPEGCRAVAGVPPFNISGGDGRLLKWVSRIDGSADIAYLVRSLENFEQAELSGFKGEIVLGAEAVTQVISGDSSVSLSPYHWVDANSDNMIDDEEIIAFYDLFSGVKLDIERDLIDGIWASRGYQWDKENGQYKILP
ncbi:MAG: helix-turn-helix transcriptional regulator [Desulfobia sp.]